MTQSQTRYLPDRIIKRMQENTHIIDGSDCHICTAHSSGKYPKFWWRNEHGKKIKMQYSRIAWAVKHGGFPSRGTVYPTCDNSRCVNPDHMVVGSSRDAVTREPDPQLPYEIEPFVHPSDDQIYGERARRPGQCVYGAESDMCRNPAKTDIPKWDIQGLCEEHYEAYKGLRLATGRQAGRPPQITPWEEHAA